MNAVVIASSEADADAAAAVERHHAQLAGALAVRVETLVGAAAAADAAAAGAARDDLVAWCERELLPHALVEEESIYPAGRGLDRARLLVDGMVAEHEVIAGLVRELAAAADPVRAAAGAVALQAVLGSHLHKENELLLPLLVGAPDVALAELLGSRHEVLGGGAGAAGPARSGCGGHSCGCEDSAEPGYPELDARGVPHAIRHATVFGALDAVPAGGGMVLVAPHDPLPLLAQLERRSPGAFEVGYLERGPEMWRLSFVRRAAT